MHKRKDPSESSSSIQRSSPNIPLILWSCIFGFLDKTSHGQLIIVNKLLVNSYLEYARQRCPINLKFSFTFPIHSFDPNYINEFKSLNTELKQRQELSTLADKSYSSLFIALQKGEEKAAINFVDSLLESKKESLEKIIEKIFLQKKSDGETAINLANRLNYNEFLNNCFYKLNIVNLDQKTVSGNSVIKTSSLDRVMETLNSKMNSTTNTERCVEALWMFALAYICKQNTICQQIASKRFWEKSYQVWDTENDNVNNGISLVLIAALLGSFNLMQYVLYNIPKTLAQNENLSNLMYIPTKLSEYPILHHDYEFFNATPLIIALIGNNLEQVNMLLTIVESNPGYDEEKTYFLNYLLLFDLKNRNRQKFQEHLNLKEVDAKIFTRSLKIEPRFLGMSLKDKYKKNPECLNTVLVLTLASGWQYGINLMWETIRRFIQQNREIGPIINMVIMRGDFSLFKKLYDIGGVSLNKQYHMSRTTGLTYPLIPAVLYNSSRILLFIEKKIDDTKVLKQQIRDKLNNLTENCLTDGLAETLKNYEEILPESSISEALAAEEPDVVSTLFTLS